MFQLNFPYLYEWQHQPLASVRSSASVCALTWIGYMPPSAATQSACLYPLGQGCPARCAALHTCTLLMVPRMTPPLHSPTSRLGNNKSEYASQEGEKKTSISIAHPSLVNSNRVPQSPCSFAVCLRNKLDVQEKKQRFNPFFLRKHSRQQTGVPAKYMCSLWVT